MLDQMAKSTASQLTLVNMTGEPDTEWMNVLKSTSSAWSVQTMPRLSDIQVALEEDDDLYAVIVYNPAVRDIVRALNAGEAPSEALVIWQNFAEDLVGIHRNFWERITVLDTTVASSSGFETLAKRLESAAGIVLQDVVKIAEANSESKREGGQEDLQLAALQLLSMRKPKQLIEELENITLSEAERFYAPDLVASYLEKRAVSQQDREVREEQTKELVGLKKELGSVSKENSIIIEQLHKSQEELEGFIRKNRDSNKKLQSLRRGREYRRGKIAELEAELHQQDEKIRGFRQGRDYRKAKITELEIELQTLRDLIEQQEAKIDGFRRGRDYRKEKVTHLESELLERDEKIEWLRSVKDQHRQNARSLRTERERQQERIDALENRLKSLDAKLTSMKNSRSWRYTKPLRKLNGTES